MILAAFTRWSARTRLDKARRAYGAAQAEWRAAEDRQDTRRMHDAHARLLSTNHARMAAEAACLPKPQPLPRIQGAA